MSNIAAQLVNTAHLFRQGKEPQASKELMVCLDLLELHYHLQLQTPQVQQILVAALDAQARQDWYGLADSLEYELVSILTNA